LNLEVVLRPCNVPIPLEEIPSEVQVEVSLEDPVAPFLFPTTFKARAAVEWDGDFAVNKVLALPLHLYPDEVPVVVTIQARLHDQLPLLSLSLPLFQFALAVTTMRVELPPLNDHSSEQPSIASSTKLKRTME
jgi:hypothetical protein